MTPNRVTHAGADIWLPYTDAGTPLTSWAYNGGCSRPAIRAYARYIDDPFYQPEPTAAEIRLLVEYCAYFISAPIWVYPAEQIRGLRLSILRVQTAEQLAGWLWGCATIGLGSVLGGI